MGLKGIWWNMEVLANSNIVNTSWRQRIMCHMLSVYILSYLLMVISISFRWKDMESNSDILIFLIFVFPQNKRLHWSKQTSVGCRDFSSQLPTVSPCPHGAWRRQHLLWRVGPGWKMLDHRLVPCIFAGDLISIHVGSIEKLFYNIWTLSGRLGWTLHGLKQPQLPGCHCWPCLPSSITRCLAAPMEQRFGPGGLGVNTSREWIMSHELCAFNIFLGWLVITVDTFLFDD